MAEDFVILKHIYISGFQRFTQRIFFYAEEVLQSNSPLYVRLMCSIYSFLNVKK